MVAGLFKSLNYGLCGVGKLAGLPFQAHRTSTISRRGSAQHFEPAGGQVSIAMLEVTIGVLGGESSRVHVLGLEERARRSK